MSQQQPPSESSAAAAQREALVQACGEHLLQGDITSAQALMAAAPRAGGSVGGSAGCVSDLLELAATTHKLLGGARRFLQWAVGGATTSGADGYTVGGGVHDSSALKAVGVPL